KYASKITFASPLIENPEIFETLASLEKGNALKANLSPVCQVYFLLNEKGAFEVYDSLTSEFLRINDLCSYSNVYYLKNLLHALPGQKLIYLIIVNNVVNGDNYCYLECDNTIYKKHLKLCDYISINFYTHYDLCTIMT